MPRGLLTSTSTGRDASDSTVWEGVQTWLGEEGPGFLYYAAPNNALDDPFLNALCESQPLTRLRNVGFLGAIDYLKFGNGSAAHRRRHSRYEHSVAVSALAVRYSEASALAEADRKLLASAALLHDVGHGPLSHTLEPVFRDVFAIDHHTAGLNILTGHSPWGESIKQIFLDHRVDIDGVIALLTGTYGGPHQFLFASPINIDTIEAINRCRLFLHEWIATAPAYHLVDAIAQSDAFPMMEADAFWVLKDQVYNTLIHSRVGQILDATAQAYMRANIHRFSILDFYRTETALRRREPQLFAILDAARNPPALRSMISPSLAAEAIPVTSRHFYVDMSINVSSTDDLKDRYRQSRSTRHVQLMDLWET